MPNVDRKVRARSKYKQKRKFYGNQHAGNNNTDLTTGIEHFD